MGRRSASAAARAVPRALLDAGVCVVVDVRRGCGVPPLRFEAAMCSAVFPKLFRMLMSYRLWSNEDSVAFPMHAMTSFKFPSLVELITWGSMCSELAASMSSNEMSRYVSFAIMCDRVSPSL